MPNSTHRAEVIQIEKLEKHPNADTLDVVTIWGYTAIVRTGDFKVGDVAVYIPPDSVVPDTPAFAFLGDSRRIRVKKLRGIVSMGLLIPAPPGAFVGDDLADAIGIKHYVPPEPLLAGAEAEAPPPAYAPDYDIDSLYRYTGLFERFEPIVITEKMHGTSSRYLYQDGRMWAGSRNMWKVKTDTCIYWKVLEYSPWMETFCRNHPGKVVYAELYGLMKGMGRRFNYGLAQGQYRLAAFDILDGSRWVDYFESRNIGKDLQWVPTVAVTNFTNDEVMKHANGPSVMPGVDHPREGIVIKPQKERTSPALGRVQLKIVSTDYLEKDV